MYILSYYIFYRGNSIINLSIIFSHIDIYVGTPFKKY